VFNFIGEVNKILFGTMDNDDAQYYNEQIKRSEQNSGSLTDLDFKLLPCSEYSMFSFG